MGDTRCKHCGKPIAWRTRPSGWWVHLASRETPYDHYECMTVATPEEARRG